MIMFNNKYNNPKIRKVFLKYQVCPLTSSFWEKMRMNLNPKNLKKSKKIFHLKLV